MRLCAYLAHISGDIIPLRPRRQSSGIFLLQWLLRNMISRWISIQLNLISIRFKYVHLSLRAIPDLGKNKIKYGIYLKLVLFKKSSFQGSTQIREVFKSIE